MIEVIFEDTRSEFEEKNQKNWVELLGQLFAHNLDDYGSFPWINVGFYIEQ
jgi:hypothetical protein